MMVLLGALSWQAWYSLLLIVALVINTIVLSYGKPQMLRKSIILTSSMILAYNCFVFSLGGIANEGLSVVSSIIGIIRFRQNASKTEYPEQDNCTDISQETVI